MMEISKIRNDKYYFWTNHAKHKMLQYNLSPTAVKNVIRNPERVEEGIAPKTTAVMKRKDTKKAEREIWVMYQKFSGKVRPIAKSSGGKTVFPRARRVKIISAWIYPGVSPVGKEIYVPEDVWEALENKIAADI